MTVELTRIIAFVLMLLEKLAISTILIPVADWLAEIYLSTL